MSLIDERALEIEKTASIIAINNQMSLHEQLKKEVLERLAGLTLGELEIFARYKKV